MIGTLLPIMIVANNISVLFGERVLFKEVNIKFLPGNTYGMIGANGAGKSTFLKVLAGEIEPNSGNIEIGKGLRLAMLKQDQFAFDDFTVMDTIIMGHHRLYQLQQEREAIYAKADFSEDDGVKAADLEAEFAELGGYDAEYNASQLLHNLGIEEEWHYRLMRELEAIYKVRVLLAQALFGTPDILLLDEPTNQLDLHTIRWLEEFLINYDKTVIVVSHDRHFLNNVCTHTADVDFGQIRLYVGNYDFWYHAAQLAAKQRREANRKREDKIAELQQFVLRFSSNRSKAKQATSRKKLIDKLSVDDFPETMRKFPYIDFKPDRPCGDVVLRVEGISKTVEGEQLLKNFNLTVEKGDKIAFVGPNDLAKTVLFDVIMGNLEADAGKIYWGQTILASYFPKENSHFFTASLNLVEWLAQFSKEQDETFLRGFLGRMLFSGDEALKSSNVLSGGEKVRCMLSKMMLSGGNVLVLDEPTNHLDLEAITALNEGLERFPEVVLFTTHDFEFIDTVANRIIELTPRGVVDRRMPFQEYVDDPEVARLRAELYAGERVLVF